MAARHPSQPRSLRRTQGPTRQDVAELAGVSKATVSQVLGKAPYARISPRTQERVLAAAKALKYRPHACARSLITGKTHTVAVVLYHHRYFSDPALFPGFVSAAIYRAATCGYNVRVATTVDSPEAHNLHFMTCVRERSVDGLIIYDQMFPEEAMRELAGAGFPFVSVDWTPPGLEGHLIPVDPEPAFRAAVEQASRGAYGWFWYVRPPGRHTSDSQIAVLIRTCGEAKLTPVFEGFEDTPETENGYRTAAFAQLIQDVRQRLGPRGVMFMSSDHIPAVITALRRLDLSSPEDIGIVLTGRWNDLMGHFPFCCFEISHERLAQRAVEKLIWMLEGRRGAFSDESVSVRFLPGDSVLTSPPDSRGER